MQAHKAWAKDVHYDRLLLISMQVTAYPEQSAATDHLLKPSTKSA